jgi:hypothetical protein
MSFFNTDTHSGVQQDQCRLFVTYDEAIEILSYFFFIAA